MSERKVQERVVHKLYGKLNSLFGDEVVIQRGAVARRYAVNRFNVDVTHRDRDGGRLDEMRETLIADLMIEGWTRMDPKEARKVYYTTATVLTMPVDGARVRLYIEQTDREHWDPTIRLNTGVDRA